MRENRDLAEAFVAFVLSDAFQADIPLQMWVFPVNENVELPRSLRDCTLRRPRRR